MRSSKQTFNKRDSRFLIKKSDLFKVLRMNFKVFLFVACLICAISTVRGLSSAQKPVAIPADCASACPPSTKYLCAKNTITNQLGTFESDCVFGRYNSCVKTPQKYEFVKYGDC